MRREPGKATITKVISATIVLLFCVSLSADTHTSVQAVDADGVGTHPSLFNMNKVTIEGVILNRPDYMVNAKPNQDAPYGPGAMWQIYIQGDVNDHAGTAVWIGQCYDNVGGSGTYTDQQWAAEIFRISHDPVDFYHFMPGDRVRVTGLLKFHLGKVNINERHDTEPDYDFEIELLEESVGLPQPELITLDEVKDVNDDFIFDANRLTGCEYYQGRLIRVNDVAFQDVNNWGPNAAMTVEDANGFTFPVLLGRGPGFSPACDLSDTFDVIGILDQESSGGSYKNGYRIWVVNYDGNGAVLTDRGLFKNRLDGDIDIDGRVDWTDFAIMADNWLLYRTEGM